MEQSEPPALKDKLKDNDEDKYTNILLLGETGTGKSTFINAFANYVQFSSLREAEEQTKLTCLIPTKFCVTTETGEPKQINFLKDENEDKDIGNSSTQGTKTYVFPFDKHFIRLIDTPGLNDSRGALLKDRENFENILEYVGQFPHLHGICFVLKPDVTVLTAAFKYCLIELFSRLDRSAARNIIFLFTRTSSTDYSAPDTLNCIKRVLDDIAKAENVTIPLRVADEHSNNCFFFDNEGFKYLVARKEGIEMRNKSQLISSWNVSFMNSWSLIQYILGDGTNPPLAPHKVQDTVSVNKARLLIFELAKPLADITELVQDNLDALKAHKAKIEQGNISAEELKKIMYVPVLDLEETVLNKPVTVCAASKCCEIYTVAGIQKYHYKQRCHNPCYLNGVAKDIIGDPRLIGCAAMGGKTNCKMCGCHFTSHMHVYYETRTVEKRIEDKTVQSQLVTNDEIIKAQSEFVRTVEERVENYQKEHQEISIALATFAYFLRNNSICPINDAYEDYLDVLIQGQKVGVAHNKDLLNRYESLKKEHMEQKRILEEAGKLAKSENIKHVTSDDVLKIWERLKTLPLTGEKIDGLHRALVTRKRQEYSQLMEYIHPQTIKKPQKKKWSPYNEQRRTEKFNFKDFTDKFRSMGFDFRQRTHSSMNDMYALDDSFITIVKNLTIDEIDYELDIRGINPARGATFVSVRKKLLDVLESEDIEVAISAPIGTDYRDEIDICKMKYIELFNMVQSFDGKSFNYGRFNAGMFHLKARAYRIKQTSFKDTLILLWNKIEALEVDVEDIINPYFKNQNANKQVMNSYQSTYATPGPSYASVAQKTKYYTKKQQAENHDFWDPHLVGIPNNTAQYRSQHFEKGNENCQKDANHGALFAPGEKVQIHKWNIKFRGKKEENVKDFLTEVHNLAKSYKVSNDDLFSAVHDILADDALIWFYSQRQITSWSKFAQKLRKKYK